MSGLGGKGRRGGRRVMTCGEGKRKKKVSVETERVKRCKEGQQGQKGGHGVR